MALSDKVHRLYGVVLLGTDEIDQNAQVTINPGITEMLLNDGVDNNFVAVSQQDARIRVITSAVATALGIAGIGGKKVEPTDEELVMFLRKVEELGTYVSGSNHVKITGKNGLFYPQTLNADNVSGSIAYEFVPFWDGTNAPLIIATGQALSGTPTIDEAFVLGPVKINGTQLEGGQSVSIGFGIQPMVTFADGDVWPKFVAIARRQPMIRVRTVDATVLDTFGLSGTAQGETDSEIWLRSAEKDGVRHGDGESEHIKILVDAGMITVNDLAADPNTEYAAEVVIRPTWDGTNDVLAITTGQAIS